MHGIDMKRELPEYDHLVRPVNPKERRRSAETACGGSVSIDGEVGLAGLIDDNLHTIAFKDMKL